MLLGRDFFAVDEIVLLDGRGAVGVLSRLCPHLPRSSRHLENLLLLSGHLLLIVSVPLVHHSEPHGARYENVIICVVGRVHLGLHVGVILAFDGLEVLALASLVGIVVSHVPSVVSLRVLLVMTIELLDVETVPSLVVA